MSQHVKMADKIENVGCVQQLEGVQEVQRKSYEEVVTWFSPEATNRPVIVFIGNRLIINDHSHGPHDEEHPDDGTTSSFALALAEKMAEFGIESTVRRLD